MYETDPESKGNAGVGSKKAEATRMETMSQWGPCADMRRSPRQEAVLAVAAKTHDMVEVYRVLAHPSEEMTQKKVQAIGIVTTGQ